MFCPEKKNYINVCGVSEWPTTPGTPWNTPGMELTPGKNPGTPWNGKLPLEKYQKTPRKRFFEIDY